MVYANSDAIHRDYHFEVEAMGHWYCDSCVFPHEMDWDDRECEVCGSNMMSGGPCGHCDKTFCLACDEDGIFADGWNPPYDIPETDQGKFYCGGCVVKYKRE